MAQAESNLHPVLRGSPRYPSDKDSLYVGGNAGTTSGGVKYAGKRKGPKALNAATRKRIARRLRAQRTAAQAANLSAAYYDGLAEVIDLVGPRGWSHEWVPGSPEALAEKLHWNEEKGGEARAAAALHGKGELSGPESKIVRAATAHPGHYEAGHKQGVEEAHRIAAERKGLDPEAVKAAGKAMEARAKEHLAKEAERKAELDKAKKEGGNVEAVRAHQVHEMLHGAADDPAVQQKQEAAAKEWNRKKAEQVARRNEKAQAAALGVQGPIRHGGKAPAAERAPRGPVERRAQAHEAQAAKHIDRAEKARAAGRPKEAVKHEQAAAASVGRAHGIRAFIRYLAASFAAGHRTAGHRGVVAAGRAQRQRYKAGEFNKEAVKARKAVKKAAAKLQRQQAKAGRPTRRQLVGGAARGARSEAAKAGRGVRMASNQTGQNVRRAARAIRAEHQANKNLRRQARQPLFFGATGKPTSAPKQAWPAPNWNLADSGGDVVDLATQVASTTDGPTATRVGMADLVRHVRRRHGSRIPRGTTAVGIGRMHRALHRKGADHSHKQGALVGGTKQVAGKNTEGTKPPATGSRRGGEAALRLGGTYEVWGRALDLASNVLAEQPQGRPGGGSPAVSGGTNVPMTSASAMLGHLTKAHGMQITAAALRGADNGAVFRMHRMCHSSDLFPGERHEHPGADLAGNGSDVIDLRTPTKAQRKAMPASRMGLPKEGKFPLDTQGRAANAKGRALQALKKGRISQGQYRTIVNKANRVLKSG